MDSIVVANVITELTKVKARLEAVERGSEMLDSSASRDPTRGKESMHLTKRIEYQFRPARKV